MLVPLPPASCVVSIEPRAQPTSTTATAPSAAASSGVKASRPSCTPGARTVRYSSSAGDERQAERGEHTAAGEQRVRDDLARRRAGPAGDRGDGESADPPAGERRADGERGRLGEA